MDPNQDMSHLLPPLPNEHVGPASPSMAEPFTIPEQAPQGVYPRFYKMPRRVEDRKSAMGFRIREVEMVDLHIAGDTKNTPARKVTDHHRRLFHDAYQMFKRGEQMATSGYPIDIWPPLQGRPAVVATMKLHNVFTVEALAEVSDSLIQQLGLDAEKLRTQARATIENAKAEAPLAKLQAQLDDMKAANDARDAATAEKDREIAELKAQLADKPKRGRPPKQAEAETEAA